VDATVYGAYKQKTTACLQRLIRFNLIDVCDIAFLVIGEWVNLYSVTNMKYLLATVVPSANTFNTSFTYLSYKEIKASILKASAKIFRSNKHLHQFQKSRVVDDDDFIVLYPS